MTVSRLAWLPSHLNDYSDCDGDGGHACALGNLGHLFLSTHKAEKGQQTDHPENGGGVAAKATRLSNFNICTIS